MLNFKNYLFGKVDFRAYGQVYHDQERKQAVLTDGRFMILSKENFNSSKTMDYLSKNADKNFDWETLNYIRVVPEKDSLVEFDSSTFKADLSSCNKLFEDRPKISDYEELLEDRVYFKDFDTGFTLPIIYIVNQFLEDSKDNKIKVFIPKESRNKALVIESYDFFGELADTLIFMPIVSGMDYSKIVEKGVLRRENGTFEESIEKSYSWSDMANEFTSRGIPHSVVSKIADVEVSSILKRPVMSIFKFDDWLHERYGNYESKGKSMRDMFKELFGDDADKMAYYFAVEGNKAKEQILIMNQKTRKKEC